MFRDYLDFVIVISWLIIDVGFSSTQSLDLMAPSELMEYCQWEVFNATCSSDQVVLMQSALYGRMRFGRCMREDHGSTGCKAVVLPILDQLCSGRRSCQLSIPDATLHSVHQCPKELMPYLEASYSCITVKSGSIQACALFGGQPLPPEVGYLASVTSTETGVGLVNCPWLIEAQSGHKVNLTLFTFSGSTQGIDTDPAGGVPPPLPLPPPPVGTGGGGGHHRSGCPWTIVVRESNLTVQLPGCSEFSREKLIYTSHGGNVHVHLSQTPAAAAAAGAAAAGGGTAQGGSDGAGAAGTLPPILLRYQVFGCADMGIVSNAAMKRYGDTTIIRCLANGHTFVFTCVENQWRGEMANCSKAASAVESGQMELKHGGIPYGLLLVIGVGILMGLLLGVLMLFTILYCLRRQRWKRTRRSQTTDPLFQRVEFDDVSSSVYLERRRASSPAPLQGLCPYHHHLRHQWSNEAAATAAAATANDLSYHSALSSDLDGTVFSTLSSSFDGGTESRTLPRSIPYGEGALPYGERPTPTPSMPSLRCHSDRTLTPGSPPPTSTRCLEVTAIKVGQRLTTAGELPPPPPPPPPQKIYEETKTSEGLTPVILDLLRESMVTVPGLEGSGGTRHLHAIAEAPCESLHHHHGLGSEP